jgi:hypothetical protein
MKKTLLTLLSLLFCAITFAQSVPQGINYQALARDASGAVLMNQALTIQFSVISDITTSAVSWQETHLVTTNDYGLYTAIIGGGTSTSVGSSLTFDVIDWGASNHLLKVEVDYGGGLLDMGTTAFMSVPYSMNASNVDPTDELQSLSISGDTLFISSGNYILIPGLSLINSLIVNGCTDPTAFNYDASANMDDGSCIAVVNGCMDPTAFNYDASANTDDGSCIAVVNGCTESTATNYTAAANTDDGSCTTLVVNGCTDSTAFNYNAAANTDDGSCIAVVNGCTDSTAFNYNAAANTDDGSCIAAVNGCTNSLASNYNAAANTDDGSCIGLGCTELLACNYNSNANISNFSDCDFSCYSCSDSTACNYDTTASIPQSYINLFGIPWDAFMLQMNLENELGYSNYYLIENQIDFCDENYITGFDCVCSESYSSNMEHGYGSNSYVFTPYVCGDTAMSGNTSGYATVVVVYPCNVSYGFWSGSSGYCEIDITIPITMSQFTIANTSGYVEYNVYYNSQLTTINQIDIGPYVIVNLIDTNASNLPCQAGCTDSTATNYNPAANTDDGSCTFSLSIGDTHQGGIVFYLDGNGGGLIAAPTDQSTGAEWGCYGALITGADGTAIGTGAQNTIDIEAGCSAPGTAADICSNLVLAGYTDWFLPSKDELNLMYLNIGQGNAMGLGNVGGFAGNFYWGSTEAGNYAAWVQDFYDGVQSSNVKYYSKDVRAVRAF